MSKSLVFEPFLMPVGWIAIGTRQPPDYLETLRTLPLERYIPLH
jgi:hypothetical protein